MEYRGATIVALLIFGLLFVGAIYMVQSDPEVQKAREEASAPYVHGEIPDPQPDNIDEDADTEYTELPSGLKYKILRKSDKRKATTFDAVAVAYRGWFEGGAVFDSSYNRKPNYFAVDPPWGVISGWKEALQLIGEGGMIELEIPPDLAYGTYGQPPKIPPNATLWFTVEILKVFTDEDMESAPKTETRESRIGR